MIGERRHMVGIGEDDIWWALVRRRRRYMVGIGDDDDTIYGGHW